MILFFKKQIGSYDTLSSYYVIRFTWASILKADYSELVKSQIWNQIQSIL